MILGLYPEDPSKYMLKEILQLSNKCSLFFGEFRDGISSYVEFVKSIDIDTDYLIAAGTFKFVVFKEILKEVKPPVIPQS